MVHLAWSELRALQWGKAARRGDQVVEQIFTQAILSIAEDDRSGAAQIAERAADVLVQRALAGEAASAEAFRREMLATGWALIRAQTAMAPLVNLVNTVLWKIEESEVPSELRESVVHAAEKFKRQLRQHALRVAEGSLGLIGDGSVVVTISFSSTVQHALTHAQRAGRRLEVLCAESQPGREGRATAEVLVNCGVQATLLPDAEAIAAVARADLVLVGADMLTSSGLVNKMGTNSLATAARAADRPFYTLCGSEKFLPPGFRPPAPANRATSAPLLEIAQEAHIPERVFDFTPLDLLSGIVTEQGVLPIEGIEAWLAATKLHPALAAQMMASES
jgi:translation initiation factor 2B subunit (eIF-2B alpha/beta/delta family)